jgi:hypothetical protein
MLCKANKIMINDAYTQEKEYKVCTITTYEIFYVINERYQIHS